MTAQYPWDLAIITPTRGRPANLRRLIAACQATCHTAVTLFVGLDDDDPALPEYMELLYPPYDEELQPLIRGIIIDIRPRMPLAGWTNLLARKIGRGARYLASLGDDHLPITQGWDAQLIAAIEDTGRPGIAYGDDRYQRDRLPTAPVMSASIVTALGWMCLPGLSHYWIDNVWHDIGTAAACLHYCPEVTVEHLHWAASPAVLRDTTYTDAEPALSGGLDHARYRAWIDSGGPAHAANRIKEIP